MKFILPFLLLLSSTYAYANNIVAKYAASQECQSCHTQIYNEYTGSMHANSTPQKDPIHASVWNKHPKNLKLEQYSCGKCHTPTADNLEKMLDKGKKAKPQADNETHQAGISCAYCHRIESIELHKKTNTNIMSTVPKQYFGTLEESMESPYHGTIKEENEHMKNGNVCIGCHSHKMNKFGLNVCSTNIDNELDRANCVSCHMPKVKGSVSPFKDTKEHAFHGFPGAHFNSEMLTKYVGISVLREIKSFKVNIDNQTSHAMLLHPLRLAVLKVEVVRNGKTTAFKEQFFERVIGANGKPSMPWLAKTEIRNSMIKANEKRTIEYDFSIQKGDKLNVILGWYLVNPKALKKLNLEDEKVATDFNEFKKQTFNF